VGLAEVDFVLGAGGVVKPPAGICYHAGGVMAAISDECLHGGDAGLQIRI
jgi:hypothetical protein